MSGSANSESKKENKVAAPPPPPAHLREPAAGAQTGFSPSSGRAITELSMFIAALAVIGALLVFFGGALAAALTPVIPVSVDVALGKASQEQFSLSQAECENPEAAAYVEGLAQTLLKAIEPLPFEFSFRVVDSDEINAFALPGGFVTVHSGLLEAASTGEEVAGVLGHEIQHALLRHGTKRILRQVGGSALLSLLLGGTDFHSYAQAAAQLSHLSYDREQESEADQRGVELMLEVGIDPSGLATFFERLGEGEIRPPVLLSTHPDPGDRARLITETNSGITYKSLPSPQAIRCHLDELP